jgi:hypothetical protein
MLLSLFLAVALCFARVRNNRRSQALLVTAIALVPFSPIGLSLLVAPGLPKLVTCCPGPGTLQMYWQSLAAQSRGECKACSDLVTGFEPRWYLVW